jgi:5-(aminomethyl)-3-furanmethanol phosphate kinase
MWVIKIGGSWVKNPKILDLIKALGKYKSSEDLILVCGGGCFADSVRSVYSVTKMSEETGNFIALKATELFSYLLKEIEDDFFLTSEINDFRKKRIKIWLPSKVLNKNKTFIENWDSTSDSVAAWLHNKISSKGLIFIKSLELKEKKYNINDLQKKEILDRNVNKYIFEKKNIKIIGPDIISLLNKSLDWDEFFLKLKEIEF